MLVVIGVKALTLGVLHVLYMSSVDVVFSFMAIASLLGGKQRQHVC